MQICFISEKKIYRELKQLKTIQCYLTQNHKLICLECREAARVERTIKSVDGFGDA